MNKPKALFLTLSYSIYDNNIVHMYMYFTVRSALAGPSNFIEEV